MIMSDVNKRLLRQVLLQSIRNLDADIKNTKPNILEVVVDNQRKKQCKQTQKNEHESTLDEEGEQNGEIENAERNEQGDYSGHSAEDQGSGLEPVSNNLKHVTAENPTTSYLTANDGVSLDEHVGDQPDGNVVQRTLATLDSKLLALLLPLCGINSYLQLPCNARNLFNAAQIILAQVARYLSQIRIHARRLTEEELANNLFAALMDIVLVLYAIGFLVLNLYQTAVFR